MSLFAELKRRNVLRVGGAYAALAWVLAQVAEFGFDTFGAPAWVLKALVVILLLGLPVALFVAWAFELTPDGVKRDTEVVPGTARPRRALDRAIIVLLAIAVAWFAWDKFFTTRHGVAPDTAADVAEPVPAPTLAEADKSVAVLPFVAMSSGPDDEFFADGLTEEILNSLAQLPGLLVTSRTSAFSFKGQNVPIQQIAAQLGVRHVVEGSVRRTTDRLRVTAQLIRADNGFHLWSKTYDRETADLFDVQVDVASNIAAALEVVMDDEQRDRMLASGTRNVEAFEAFVRGRQLYDLAHSRATTSPVTLEQANEYLGLAMELDPGYAQAAMMHADRYAHQVLDPGTRVVGASEGLDYATALQLLRNDFGNAAENASDPLFRTVAEINRELFSPHWNRIPGLLEQLEDLTRAGQRLPVDGVWLVEVMLAFGAYGAVETWLAERQAADPLNSTAIEDLIILHARRGEYDRAVEVLDEARRRYGETDRMRERAIVLAMLRHDPASALAVLDRGFDVFEDYDHFEPLRLALHGDRDAALKLADSLDRPDEHLWKNYDLFWTYYALGEQQRMREIVARTDGSLPGPVIMLVDFSVTGTLRLSPDEMPVFRSRLAEAGIDPAALPVLLASGPP